MIAAKSDILILGAGVIGLALGLELRKRGFRVDVFDSRTPLAGASTAAAGMLAVEDPHNPAELLPFSRLSGSLYPSFLTLVKELSGTEVPFQTKTTVQYMPDGTRHILQEHSIDPRQLAPALLLAALNSGVRLLSEEPDQPSETVIHTTGAWGAEGLPVTPRKGQMLRVQVPPGMRLEQVHRSEHVYVVPRSQGPQAGTALIGATVEDAGFDLKTSPEALAGLRRKGAALVPELAEERSAPALEAWAGLRPATPDDLPLLGAWEDPPHASLGQRRFIATGHFRNGILLAPATAVLMADLIEGRSGPVSLGPFDPRRFDPSRFAPSRFGTPRAR